MNMREDKGAVEVNRLLIVLGGFGEFSKNEVELGTVVIDIRVVLVVGDGELKVVGCSILIA